MYRVLRALPGVLASLTGGLLLACGSEPRSVGSVTLAMSTDLTVDQDMASVGLYVQQLDGAKVINTWGWTQDAQCDPSGVCNIRFPATFVVGAGPKQSTVRVRVVGFDKAHSAVVMRESRFTVDTDKISAIRLPMLWVNSGAVTDSAPRTDVAGNEDGALAFDPFTRFEDGCTPAGAEPKTRDDRGECVSIDSATLVESFDPNVGLGDDQQECLDVNRCFGEGERLFRTRGLHDELEGCSLEVPAALDAASVNIALVVPATSPGYQAGGLRVRPLALGSSAEACAGNDKCANSAARGAENLFFPPAVCKKMRQDGGDDPSFLVSQRCPTRTLAQPICATWNLSKGTIPAQAPRPTPTNSAATSFEISGVSGELTSFATQGEELVVGMREAGGVTAHRFVTPPFAAAAVRSAATAIYPLPAGSNMELVRVSTPRPKVGESGGIAEYSEAYALTGPDQISYLPPDGGPPVPVRIALDCTNPNDNWRPYLRNARIRGISMSRLDATAKDNAARVQQITTESGVGTLISPAMVGALALGIISYEHDDPSQPGGIGWKNTVAIAGSPLLSGQLQLGVAASLRASSADPTCIQVFKTTDRYGDPGSSRCDGIDGKTCCESGPCASVFDGAGGPLGRSTEIAPNELGNFIPFARRFAADEPSKQFRWCGVEDAQFYISKIAEVVLEGGSLNDLPLTAISCFTEYFDYTKAALSVDALAIGGGFRSPDDQDERKLFALLDSDAPNRRLTLFETNQSLFLKDENGAYLRSAQGTRRHQKRQWREAEGRVFAPPLQDTRIVSYSGDGGQTNVACYVAETPTVACYDQDGKPVSLPLDTGFVSAIHLDDTSLTDAENNLYIALQCVAEPAAEPKPGRVFVYRVPWTSITGAGVSEPLPNPCRR